MDGCLQTDPKLPVWIIEHVWAHKMMDIQKGWFFLVFSYLHSHSSHDSTLGSSLLFFFLDGDRCVSTVVDPCLWPDVDSQPLSLEDSWRLRVASAQAYSIMRRRDVELFEKVMVFLEATHRLLPGLVPAIKHMKIMFGLKTMVRRDERLALIHVTSDWCDHADLCSVFESLSQVIMWMLRERRGMIDTASKIVQFFPSKLPQYQDQCVSVLVSFRSTCGHQQ